jgi:hypothetical protein
MGTAKTMTSTCTKEGEGQIKCTTAEVKEYIMLQCWPDYYATYKIVGNQIMWKWLIIDQ